MSDVILDLAAIKARAEAASKGPWAVRPQEYDDWGWVRGPVDEDGWRPIVAIARAARTADLDAHRRAGTDPYGHNAAHIAGMDPPTTLALVAEVERLRARVAELEPSPTPASRMEARHG